MNERITLIGCGRMGSALARTLADADQTLVVWDKLPEQANKLKGNRLQIGNSLEEAVAGAAILIFCLPTYDDVKSCLRSIGSLRDTIVVNMGEGTAELAEQIEAQVRALDGKYLDAEILTRPEEIGTECNIILISGEKGSWERVRPCIGALAGDFRYVSSYIGAAGALVLSVMGSFVVAGAVALMEGARYAKIAGVDVDSFMMLLDSSMPIFKELAREGFNSMESGNYRSESVSIETGWHSAETFISGLKAKGLRADMLEAARSRFREAIDAGLGELGLFALDKE